MFDVNRFNCLPQQQGKVDLRQVIPRIQVSTTSQCQTFCTDRQAVGLTWSHTLLTLHRQGFDDIRLTKTLKHAATFAT